jgi:hypothetical protein
MLLMTGRAVGQQPSPSCPIEFQKVDPHSLPFTSGLLGSEKDPWDHYIRIEYKNMSAKTIIAIRFGVAFVDALAEANESVYSYASDQIVKPSKVAKPYWGDGVYFHQYGSRMGAVAWLEKVRFADDTFFVDDGSHSCWFPPSAGRARPTQLPAAAPPPPSEPTTIPGFQEAAKNSEAAKASPAAAAAVANVGRAVSPQELADLVQKGQASRCAVVTTPPGAEVDIDGNKAGVSPLAFVLLKQGDTPRTLTIKMTGYKTVEKKVVPDGKTIPVAVTMEKQ